MKVLCRTPVLLCYLFVGWLLTGCSWSEPDEVQSVFGYALGTSYSVKVVSSLSEARKLQLGIDRQLADIDQRMSTYRATSDISRFAEAPLNTPVVVDRETAEVVKAALAIAAKTEGAFDPTIEPLVDLWGFGPTPRNKSVPKADAIAKRLAEVGYQAVSVDLDKHTLAKSQPRELDLSAIAKGYAVDQVATYIEDQGFSSYLVEVGGEMRFSGHKPNKESWAVAIEKPVVDERTPYLIVRVDNGAMATSGDYRNYFEVDGRRYSHTIDPATGYPVDHKLASVTVVMPTCMAADAYATAFNVMGTERALRLADSLNIATFLIYRDAGGFKALQSKAFSERFGSLIN